MWRCRSTQRRSTRSNSPALERMSAATRSSRRARRSRRDGERAGSEDDVVAVEAELCLSSWSSGRASVATVSLPIRSCRLVRGRRVSGTGLVQVGPVSLQQLVHLPTDRTEIVKGPKGIGWVAFVGRILHGRVGGDRGKWRRKEAGDESTIWRTGTDESFIWWVRQCLADIAIQAGVLARRQWLSVGWTPGRDRRRALT